MMTDTPSGWSASDDGLEPALLLYDGVVVAVFHAPNGLFNAKRAAEALNVGTAAPSVAELEEWLQENRDWQTDGIDRVMNRRDIQDVLDARAALVRKRIDG